MTALRKPEDRHIDLRASACTAGLSQFTVALLRFTLVALEPVGLPSFSGSTFRGAFGTEFRRIACMPICNDAGTCPIASQCAYARVFEAKPVKEGYVPSGDGGLPRPFVIHPPLGRMDIEPGERFTFHLVLVGWAADYIPYFILTWRELGRIGLGRGRGRFRLERVESVTSIDGDADADQARLIYNSEDELVRNCVERLTSERLLSLRPSLGQAGDSNQSEQLVLGKTPESRRGDRLAIETLTRSPKEQAPTRADAGGDRLALEIVTPLRLKSNGEFLRSDLPFAVLAGALIRRLESLSFFYGSGSLGLNYGSLIEQARQIKAASTSVRWIGWERYSSRQDRRVPWGGLLGRVEYQGDWQPFAPFLILGEIIGVGNNCAFGLGRIRGNA